MPDNSDDHTITGCFRRLIPLKGLRIALLCLLGAFAGLGIMVLHISNAMSYLSDDPKACINCHIMTPQYATWLHSSHGRNTTCNDCHVPHDNVFRKYYFKAKDGTRHAAVFTLRMEPQVFKLNEAAKQVVQENCLRCHENVVNAVSASNVNGENYKAGEGLLCWQCHRETPHGRVASQASTPNAIIPGLSAPAPDWIRKIVNHKQK